MLVLFMAWMMGMYFVSSVPLMRMNLPPMYRKAIPEVHACDAGMPFFAKACDVAKRQIRFGNSM